MTDWDPADQDHGINFQSRSRLIELRERLRAIRCYFEKSYNPRVRTDQLHLASADACNVTYPPSFARPFRLRHVCTRPKRFLLSTSARQGGKQAGKQAGRKEGRKEGSGKHGGYESGDISKLISSGTWARARGIAGAVTCRPVVSILTTTSRHHARRTRDRDSHGDYFFPRRPPKEERLNSTDASCRERRN